MSLEGKYLVTVSPPTSRTRTLPALQRPVSPHNSTPYPDLSNRHFLAFIYGLITQVGIPGHQFSFAHFLKIDSSLNVS